MKLHEIQKPEESNFLTNEVDIADFLINRCELWPSEIKFANDLTNIIGAINMTGYNVSKFPILKTIPIKFGYVTGEFDISHNEITNFEGCPQLTGNSFVSTSNPVTSFKNITEHIGDSVFLADTKITSLIGVEKHIKRLGFNVSRWSGEFMLPWKNITEGGIGLILIEGKFTLVMPGLKTKAHADLPEQFKIIQKYIGCPDGIYDCQAELIENGYEEYAKL